MKKEQRHLYAALLQRLGAERSDFFPMLCNVCRFMDCRTGDDWDCVHPLSTRLATYGVAAAIENGQQGEDCWLFRPRLECRSLDATEVFVRSGAVDARETD